MGSIVRWLLVTVFVVHGLVHFLGVAKGFGWAPMPQLRESIGAGMGVVWLAAGLLVLAAATVIVAGAPPWWWLIALLAAVVSQVAVVSSWSDARAGTLANVILLVVAAYGFLAAGPFSFAAHWTTHADAALEQVDATPRVLTEADLQDLPTPLAAYIRASGAVGKPRTVCFGAVLHGRIRSSPDARWMTFTGRQVNTFGENPRRMFLMHARRSGVPIEVLHLFGDATATMQVKMLSVFPIVDARGPEMDRGEAVTIFQELVAFAPGAIVDTHIRWSGVDEHRVRGVYTLGEHCVSATLTFDEHNDLVDFVSPDRLRASEDGSSFTKQEWSTPLLSHRDVAGRRVLATGEGWWSAPQPEGLFAYLEIQVDDISFNVHSSAIQSSAHEAAVSSPTGGR